MSDAKAASELLFEVLRKNQRESINSDDFEPIISAISALERENAEFKRELDRLSKERTDRMEYDRKQPARKILADLLEYLLNCPSGFFDYREKIGELMGELGLALDAENAELKREHEAKRVVICGSSRFIEIMAVCAWLIERDECKITTGLHLLPQWYTGEESHLAEAEGVAGAMDELHLRKIDMSDEIFVVNVENYVGDSTQREINYAMERGKTIRWFTEDEIGVLVRQAMSYRLARRLK